MKWSGVMKCIDVTKWSGTMKCIGVMNYNSATKYRVEVQN